MNVRAIVKNLIISQTTPFWTRKCLWHIPMSLGKSVAHTFELSEKCKKCTQLWITPTSQHHSESVFLEMYLTCVSSKLCEFISLVLWSPKLEKTIKKHRWENMTFAIPSSQRVDHRSSLSATDCCPNLPLCVDFYSQISYRCFKI